jgi:hypothetical protein
MKKEKGLHTLKKESNNPSKIKRIMAHWIGNILLRKCLLKPSKTRC